MRFAVSQASEKTTWFKKIHEDWITLGEKMQKSGNIRYRWHQVNKEESKSKKGVPLKNQEIFRNQIVQQKSNHCSKHLGSTYWKILWTLFKTGQERNSKIRMIEQRTWWRCTNLRDDIDKTLRHKKRKGRWLTSIRDCVDAAIQGFKEYL